MNSIERVLSEYDRRLALYRELGRKICDSLAERCQNERIHVHAIQHRLKSRESLIAKLNRPDAPYRALGDLTDIAGIRVITYYASDVDRVAEIVRREYAIDEENSIDKGALLDPDRFGYMSIHNVVSLRESTSRLRRGKLTGLKAEIQIRSILQHAWAEIEHDLGYKSEYAVPRKVRRTFSQLSGLLELADQEFDGVLQSLRDYAGEIAGAPESEVTIDRVSVAHFIKSNRSFKALDQQIREQVDLPMIFEEWFVDVLVERLDFVGIPTISSLEAELDRLSKTTSAMAVDHIKASGYTRIHDGTGLYYFCSTFLADSDPKRIPDYLRRSGVRDRESRQRLSRNIFEKYHLFDQADDLTEPS